MGRWLIPAPAPPPAPARALLGGRDASAAMTGAPGMSITTTIAEAAAAGAGAAPIPPPPPPRPSTISSHTQPRSVPLSVDTSSVGCRRRESTPDLGQSTSGLGQSTSDSGRYTAKQCRDTFPGRSPSGPGPAGNAYVLRSAERRPDVVEQRVEATVECDTTATAKRLNCCRENSHKNARSAATTGEHHENGRGVSTSGERLWNGRRAPRPVRPTARHCAARWLPATCVMSSLKAAAAADGRL